MSLIIVQVELANNSYAELAGDNVKLWVGEGLAVYEGLIDGLPEVVLDELKIRKIIRVQ